MSHSVASSSCPGGNESVFHFKTRIWFFCEWSMFGSSDVSNALVFVQQGRVLGDGQSIQTFCLSCKISTFQSYLCPRDAEINQHPDKFGTTRRPRFRPVNVKWGSVAKSLSSCDPHVQQVCRWPITDHENQQPRSYSANVTFLFFFSHLEMTRAQKRAMFIQVWNLFHSMRFRLRGIRGAQVVPNVRLKHQQQGFSLGTTSKPISFPNLRFV